MSGLVLSTRRGFLGGLLAASVAPAIVHAEWLMPIEPLGRHGWRFLQSCIDNARPIPAGNYSIDRTLQVMKPSAHLIMIGSRLQWVGSSGPGEVMIRASSGDQITVHNCYFDMAKMNLNLIRFAGP